MREIDRSPKARAILEKYKPEIRLQSQDGSTEFGRFIFVSKNMSLEEAVRAVFHELGHKNDPSRNRVRPERYRRDLEGYIAGRAEAEVKSISSENELIRDYHANGGTLAVPHDTRFYVAETGITNTAEIRRQIINGELTESIGGGSYRDLYIKEWELENGPRPPSLSHQLLLHSKEQYEIEAAGSREDEELSRAGRLAVIREVAFHAPAWPQR